jgi:hypothetical protein
MNTTQQTLNERLFFDTKHEVRMIFAAEILNDLNSGENAEKTVSVINALNSIDKMDTVANIRKKTVSAVEKMKINETLTLYGQYNYKPSILTIAKTGNNDYVVKRFDQTGEKAKTNATKEQVFYSLKSQSDLLSLTPDFIEVSEKVKVNYQALKLLIDNNILNWDERYKLAEIKGLNVPSAVWKELYYYDFIEITPAPVDIGVIAKAKNNNDALKKIKSKSYENLALTGIFHDINADVATDGYKLLVIPVDKKRKKAWIENTDTGVEITGKYANYNIVFPKDETVTARIKLSDYNVKDLMSILKGYIRIDNMLYKNIVVFSVKGAKFNFKPAELYDLLEAMLKAGVEDFLLSFTDNNRAIIIEDENKSGIKGLIMPVVGFENQKVNIELFTHSVKYIADGYDKPSRVKYDNIPTSKAKNSDAELTDEEAIALAELMLLELEMEIGLGGHNIDIPKGKSQKDVKDREKIIKQFFNNWDKQNPNKCVYNSNLKENIYVNSLGKNETMHHAARTYDSTVYLLELDLSTLLSNATFVRIDSPKSKRQQDEFDNMMILEYQSTHITLGIKTSERKVYYCLSEIE